MTALTIKNIATLKGGIAHAPGDTHTPLSESMDSTMNEPVSDKVTLPAANADSMVQAPAVTAQQPNALLEMLRQFFAWVIPPVIGLVLLVAVWTLISYQSEGVPGPIPTFKAAVILFSDPFYINNPNDMGIGWNILNSLQRVATGFGMAALVGIPLGFIIGRYEFMSRMTAPIISLLRPVSPLNLSEWKVVTKILFPYVLPYMMTGVRLSIGVAWLVIVAAEMLTGGVGIGFWVWDEWNNLNVEHIIIAIVIVGVVGLLLELALTQLAKRFSYE
jgi:nitrate/nitrite transport system permease protein